MKKCDCEEYQCCEKCMDKFKFTGKNVLEPIWDALIIYHNMALAMEKAIKKWGDLR